MQVSKRKIDFKNQRSAQLLPFEKITKKTTWKTCFLEQTFSAAADNNYPGFWMMNSSLLRLQIQILCTSGEETQTKPGLLCLTLGTKNESR